MTTHPASAKPTERTAARQRQLLLVEDEPIVTMTYQDALAGTEFVVAAILPCNNQAVAWLTGNMPDLAIVDYFLSDGPCLAVVERLRGLPVPFLVVSGVGDRPENDLLGAPWLSKPFRDSGLLQALRKLPAEYAP